MSQTTSPTKPEIVVTRLFDAPRSLVYRAFTDPERISLWWGPRGFRTTTSSMDLRPGGIWRFVMHGPDGTDYPNVVQYRDVVEGERLAYDHGAQDPTGPGSFKAEILFADVDDKTEVTLRLICDSTEQHEMMVKYGAVEGGHGTLERLSEELARQASGVPDPFVISRTFTAPRDLVFQMWTEAEHLQHWWGPKGCEIEVKHLDVRPGGTFHYAMRFNGGEPMHGRFVFQEIKPPERLRYVGSFATAAGDLAPAPFDEKWPQELLTTVTFVQFDGPTTVVVEWVPLNSGVQEHATFERNRGSMVEGWTGTFERLATYLPSTGETA